LTPKLSASSQTDTLEVINASFTCKVDVTIAKVKWIDKEKNIYEMDYYYSKFLEPGEKALVKMKPGYYAIMVQAFRISDGSLLGTMSGHGPWPPPNGVYKLVVRCEGLVEKIAYGDQQVCTAACG
jgi:hypothetical protein